MEPALAPGDYLVVDRRAYAQRAPAPGEVVVARDPRDVSREIVKRVAAASAGGVELLGDNAAASSDSRVFGPVPRAAIAGRALWRYWPRGRFGPVPARASSASTSASVGKASGGGSAGSK